MLTPDALGTTWVPVGEGEDFPPTFRLDLDVWDAICQAIRGDSSSDSEVVDARQTRDRLLTMIERMVP